MTTPVAPQQRWALNFAAIESLKSPTPDRELLEQFNGWGCIPEVFASKTKWSKAANAQLRSMLNECEFKIASSSILNAHYTEPAIVHEIWKVIKHLGFDGGKILEPSCGSGYFLRGCPKNIAERSEIYGIEIDPTAAAIAQHLHPNATIYPQPFENVNFPNEFFDLVVGNVPFGSEGVADPRYDAQKLNLHNYFLAKSVNLVREGGLVVILTSAYTLNSKCDRFRQWLSRRVRLLGAVQFPMEGFRETANTGASESLLIFQKGQIEEEPLWIESTRAEIANAYGEVVEVANNYWREHPDSLLGTPAANKLYGSGFALQSISGFDLCRQMRVELLGEIEPCYEPAAKIPHPNTTIVPPELQDRKDGEFVPWDGEWWRKMEGKITRVPKVQKGFRNREVSDVWERIEGFIALRALLDKVVAAQNEAQNLEVYQQALTIACDLFVERFGAICDRTNIKILGDDPRYWLLRTLEKNDGSKADIFTTRVSKTYVPPKPGECSDPDDAIAHSLNTRGQLCVKFCAEILACPETVFTQWLEAQQRAFYDPDTQAWELPESYLSGNVRQKLLSARNAQLDANIKVLEAVQPPLMVPSADRATQVAVLEWFGINTAELTERQLAQKLSKIITPRLGANWIDIKYYEQFAREVLGFEPEGLRYLQSEGLWAMSGKSADNIEFGTEERVSSKIFLTGLNQKQPIVSIYYSDGKRNIRASAKATEEACAKLDRMKLTFADWLWEDRQRACDVTQSYNDRVNVMHYAPSDPSWLSFPGANPQVELHPWQKKAVARIIRDRATFLAHEVGLGKTYTIATAVMECRRMGLAFKPMVVVLNGTEQQFAREWRNLYPHANLLVPPKLDREGRKLFTASIKTGDFDAVILTHPQFYSIAVSQETQMAFLDREEDILKDFLEQTRGDRLSQKQILRSLKKLRTRKEKILNARVRDNHVNFEGLTDMLVIDEIHEMKNLAINTKMTGIYGIPTAWSQRASDTHLKIICTLGCLIKNSCSGKVVGATGTMVSNTMGELYTWQRMFQPQTLEEMGIAHFDAWASTFGEAVRSAEITPTGRYQVKTRFKSFSNLECLRDIMGQFVDIATAKTVGVKIDRPDPVYVEVVSPPNDEHLQLLKDLVIRADAIKNRQVEPQEDNMLLVTTDLAKGGLSPKLIGGTESDPSSKIHNCAYNVWKIWQATEGVKGTQIVFCDLSTPKSDRWNVYNYLKSLLLLLGIPKEQIEFIHDHNGKKRDKLFDRVNRGEVRILLGSSGKLGTGCNVHLNGLWAMHHLDAPWRPADIEQREGRGIRQKNGANRGQTLDRVWIFRYITERLDALRWQTLEWKQSMIASYMAGKDIGGTLTEIDRVVHSYEQVKSIATGNPLLLEECDLRKKLNSLLIQKDAHQRGQASLEAKIRSMRMKVKNLASTIEILQSDLKSLAAPGKLQVGSKACTAKSSFDRAFKGQVDRILSKNKPGTHEVLKYRGFRLYLNITFAHGTLQHHRTFILKKEGRYDLPLKFGNKFYSIVSSNPKMESLNAAIDALNDYEKSLARSVRTTQAELDRALRIQGQPFDRQEELIEIRVRLEEIARILAEDADVLGVATEEPERGESLDLTSETAFWEIGGAVTPDEAPDREIVNLLRQRQDRSDWLARIEEAVQQL